MRDERTSKDVCGEATAPVYQERLFSLVYTQILVEYPLKLIQRAVPSGLLANLFFLLTLPPLCSPSALYEESTFSSSPVKFTWKKLYLGKWLLIWSKSIKFMKKPFGLDLLASRRRVALRQESVCCFSLKYSFTTSNEKEFFCLCVLFCCLCFFFFSTSIPVTFIRGWGNSIFWNSATNPLLLLQLIIHLLSVIICRWARLNRFLARFITLWN